ncbi:MAG TPA: tripartite tricarboxylate transporter substrate binding protein, partial [Burkholderiales bacterium]|nr:tripartite tricarboxylate transporter substrate binding protein [Burkholderiales bacterium]
MFDQVRCRFPRLIAGALLVASIVPLFATPSVAATADAASYPTKPLRFVVTFAPGGGTDVFARAIALKFTEAWSQSVIVDNRAGGNGNIGADMVAKAPADGYTVLVTTNATIVINPHLVKLPYDPVRDLAPISQLATLPFVLLVHPSLPVKSVAELIALAKAKPGQLNFGSSGGGGGAHLSGEMMKTAAKIDMTHVPYKGAAPALVALLGGEVQFMFVSILTATPLIESNRVRAIAVSGLKRSSALPNVPAVAETPGLAGFETDLWYGMLAPAKTDPAIVNKLYRETKRVLERAEFKNRF